MLDHAGVDGVGMLKCGSVRRCGSVEDGSVEDGRWSKWKPVQMKSDVKVEARCRRCGSVELFEGVVRKCDASPSGSRLIWNCSKA